MNRRLLIVSPHFPPVNAPDMQRVRVSLPYFVAAGWDVTVLTVNDPTPTAPLEPELLATIPPEVEVVRTFCLSRRWTGWLGVNNVAWRSLPFLFLAGCRLLARRRYDAVYFSTTMVLTLPLGRLWKFIGGVPYVIDLQDPWVTDYYERPGAPPPPGGWKYRFARLLARTLEGWTMRGAAELITVSAAYTDALRVRHPELRDQPATELPFGASEPDLEFAANRAKTRAPLLPAGGVRLVFAGALGPGMLGSVETLFAAIAAARKNGPNISVHFFGTSYSPAAQGRPVTLELAARHGLQDCVHEQPARLRYFDALQVTLEADVNLLFGSNDLGFNPSKTMTVLAAGKPVLALAPAGSVLARRLANLRQPCVTFPAGGLDPAGLRMIAEQLRTLGEGPAETAVPPTWQRFSARVMAGRQLEILARVATQPEANHPLT